MLGSFSIILATTLAVIARMPWVVGLGIGGAVGVWVQARRHAMPSASEILATDTRAPVLLLRSFADDDFVLTTWSWAEKTLTRLVSEYFNGVGPVIKVPPRREKLPEVGPYAVDPLRDDEWFDEVRKLVRTASVVVVLVGRSPGIIAELTMLCDEGALGKTRLLFPPVRGDELVTRWESFNELIEKLSALAPLRGIDYRQLRAAYFDPQGDLVAVCTAQATYRAYEVTVESIVRPRFSGQASEPHASARRQEAPREEAAPGSASSTQSRGEAQTLPPAGPSAGFWRRLGAFLIDLMMLSVIRGAVATMAAGGASTGAAIDIFSFFYFAGMESSQRQATVGKMALGVVVTDVSGRRISILAGAGRTLSKIVSVLALGIGFLMVAIRADKRGLHDIMAGTVVVRRR